MSDSVSAEVRLELYSNLDRGYGAKQYISLGNGYFCRVSTAPDSKPTDSQAVDTLHRSF